MSELYTTQGVYKTLRDTTAYAEGLDGVTSNKTFDWTDMPTEAVALGGEFNGCEIYFTAGEKSTNGTTTADPSNGDTSGSNDGTSYDGRLWGYTYGGPAEHIADFSATVDGSVRIKDYTTALYADTIVVSNATHLTTVNVNDSGNRRIAKIDFDTVGYSHILCEFSANGGSDTSDVKAYIRPY